MKVGDLVIMNFELPGDDDWEDQWGVGIIVIVEPRTASFGGTDIAVIWSKMGALSWEMPEMVERISASR